MASDYTYRQNVGPSQLRLLQVAHISHEILEFRVLHMNRAAVPSYTAVSYTWGDDAPSEIIKLDGQIFRVRRNLWSCLYYLGLESRHADWKYLWVDAICIDQGNDSERSAQVRHMDQTYMDATCVSVWLGLITIPDELRPLVSTLSPAKTFDGDVDWDDAIDDLANRTYWSRYWVIQEILLGNQVRLHCSNTSVDWDYFQDILCRRAGILQFGEEHTAGLSHSAGASLAALPLTLARHPDKHPEFLQPLAVLLATHYNSSCKDPRDRVFALLGLVSGDERRLLSRFFPDYTMNINIVQIITLAHLMQYEAHENPKLRNISPDSEDIFRGLGVGEKRQRRLLIGQAKEIDYLDDWGPGEFSRALQAGIYSFEPGVNETTAMVGTSAPETGMRQEWTSARDTWDTLTRQPWMEAAWTERPQSDQACSGGVDWNKLLTAVLLFSILGAAGYFFAKR